MGGESGHSRWVPGWGKSPEASNTPPTAATCWKNARSCSARAAYWSLRRIGRLAARGAKTADGRRCCRDEPSPPRLVSGRITVSRALPGAVAIRCSTDRVDTHVFPFASPSSCFQRRTPHPPCSSVDGRSSAPVTDSEFFLEGGVEAVGRKCQPTRPTRGSLAQPSAKPWIPLSGVTGRPAPAVGRGAWHFPPRPIPVVPVSGAPDRLRGWRRCTHARDSTGRARAASRRVANSPDDGRCVEGGARSSGGRPLLPRRSCSTEASCTRTASGLSVGGLAFSPRWTAARRRRCPGPSSGDNPFGAHTPWRRSVGRTRVGDGHAPRRHPVGWGGGGGGGCARATQRAAHGRRPVVWGNRRHTTTVGGWSGAAAAVCRQRCGGAPTGTRVGPRGNLPARRP